MYRKIDENGMFIEDTFEIDVENPQLYIEGDVPQGFYLPKWDGEKWVEGMAQAEIDLLKSNVTAQPTIEERVQTVETQQTEIINILAEVL